MKKHFLVKFLIGSFFLFIFSLPCYAVSIGFEPVSQMHDLGKSVRFDLVISDLGDSEAPSLGEFDLDVKFDPSILSIDSVDSVDFGLFLGDPDFGEAITDVLLPGEFRPDNTIVPDGTVNLFELSVLFPSELDVLQPDSFALASLTFETLAAGTSFLDITIISLGDGFGDPLTVSPVPEPATILLLVSGMAGLGVFGRKKSRK